MQAKARLQINIQMKKVPEIPQTANLSDLLVPIIWIEDVRLYSSNKHYVLCQNLEKMQVDGIDIFAYFVFFRALRNCHQLYLDWLDKPLICQK